MTKQPNILFIMSDQQQYATAGPAAGGWSPNLERLAREGIWFRRGYTVTTPCAPARASIATAVYPHAHHVLNNCHVPYAVSREIRDGVPTWGPLMSAAGYRMRYVGKAHLGWERGAVEYGFDSEEREFDKAAYQETIASAPSSRAACQSRAPGADRGRARGASTTRRVSTGSITAWRMQLRKQRRRRCRPRQACNSCAPLPMNPAANPGAFG